MPRARGECGDNNFFTRLGYIAGKSRVVAKVEAGAVPDER